MHGEGRQLRKSKCSCCKGKSEESGGMKLFKDFWAVDRNRKRDFVISNITVTATADKTTGDKSRRKLTVKYCLPTQQSHIQVCKEYFLSTPSIGAMFVRWTLNKSSSSSLNSNYTRRMQYNKTADIRTLCSKGKKTFCAIK